MSGSTIAKHYARILSRWPHDPIRPTVSFEAFLRKRLDQLSASSPSTTPPASASASASASTSRSSPVATTAPPAFPTASSTSAPTPTATPPEPSPSPSSDSQPAPTPTSTPPLSMPLAETLRDINALYTLLDDRYSKKYALSAKTLRPASNPTYYEALLEEMREAPKRTWFGRLMKRVAGIVRFR